MAESYEPTRSDTRISDILNVDDYQEVLKNAGKSLIDGVLGDLAPYPYEDLDMQVDKKYCPPFGCADTTFLNPINESTGPLPAREDYAGPFEFAVLFDGVESTKNKWMFSRVLNKLYIIWDKIIPIQFKWISSEPFVVRALPVYSTAQDMKEPVRRCLIHLSPADPSNEGFDYLKHVIRSDNPGAYYDENSESERCSVVVPLGEPQAGTAAVTVTYKFMCKTTCVGIMRRPITVLFTLERLNGEVVGRQKVNLKICSCPKRDMQKDESSANPRHNDAAGSSQCMPAGRKRLRSESEENYSIEINLGFRHIYKSLLESMIGTVLRELRYTPKSHTAYSELSKIFKVLDHRLRSLNE